MKEKMLYFKDKAKSFWTNRSRSQKGIFIGSIVIVAALIIGIVLFTSNTKLVPLYNNLSAQEAGQIKTELDTRGVPYELEDGGSTITVPEEQVDSLLVDFAGQGLPDSGNIDYSFFSENASWGITDNEFSMIKLDAMQTELANLIKGIDGIADAKVMINMPKDPVFVSDNAEQASASVVINTKPGQQFQGNQIETLYHLVSKAVPDLPPENIVIMNQYFEYYDQNAQDANGNQDTYTYQQTVKKDIERDIQRRVQQMLGAMVGPENVIVSVTADVDFTKENRVEEIVDPVDVENMEGVPVSIETVHETYSGNPPAGGVQGTGDEDVPGYESVDGGEDGDYELVKETVNNEYNRIHKEIAESPYKVHDLGIQVAIDKVKGKDGDELQYLSQQDENTVEDGISSILNSIITTSIDKEFGEVDPEEKTSIVFQEFSGDTAFPEPTSPVIPLWLYIVGGILLIAIIILVILLLRSRRDQKEEIEEETTAAQTEVRIPEIGENPDTEADARRKQLEKMAKEKPEDFAKLLRSWIAED
ncbi:flagellar M-ring protein [Lentibacillus populi]|uniref:Flagellar M-ring protein n=1 Tax=Lentibacillus populi TaxID=1827502 RepID=A0A9W5X401_9BACI|nr:flagellar basal-body MS-ring/collar protein FliF [Lentibacillus populi]GGB30252.1 flagellar M-ring protein [Lentibacillus populi]